MSLQCRVAAIRAYEEMKRSGGREDHAYEVAVDVFRYFHPEIRRLDAFQTVADWIDEQENGRPRGS